MSFPATVASTPTSAAASIAAASSAALPAGPLMMTIPSTACMRTCTCEGIRTPPETSPDGVGLGVDVTAADHVSRNARKAVSRVPNMAVSARADTMTRYQAGAITEPVTSISQVATNGAVPPKSALAVLKLTAKPV